MAKNRRGSSREDLLNPYAAIDSTVPRIARSRKRRHHRTFSFAEESRTFAARICRTVHPVIDPFTIQNAKDPCWIGDERISIGATLPARWQLLRKPTDSLLKQRCVGVMGCCPGQARQAWTAASASPREVLGTICYFFLRLPCDKVGTPPRRRKHTGRVQDAGCGSTEAMMEYKNLGRSGFPSAGFVSAP
jgi:hypothetical protein